MSSNNNHNNDDNNQDDRDPQMNEDEVLGEEAEHDEDEAFVDFDDPDNKVEDLDDRPPPSEVGDLDDPDAAEAAEPAGEYPEDKEPVRDDAVFTWAGPNRQPLHAVATHPSKPSIIAVGGEAEAVSIIDFSRASATSAAADENSAAPSASAPSSSAEIASRTGHKDTVTHLAFSPDGTMLASGSMDCTVRLYDTVAYDCLHVLEDLAGEVEFLLWHPSSKVLLGGGSDAQCLLWNTAKGAVAQYFVGHGGAVTCGQWASDVKKVVTGSNDGTVMVFNPKTGQCELTVNKDLSTVNAGITCLASANKAGETFVVGCEDGSLHVLNIVKGKVMKTLDDIHEQAVEAIAFADLDSGTGLFATCSCDCKVVVWAAADFTVRSVTRCGEGITRLIWVRELLAAGCTDGDTRVWDGRAAAGEPRTSLMGHRRLVLGLTVNADASHVATVADDGMLKVFTRARFALDEPSIRQEAVRIATEQAREMMKNEEAGSAAAPDTDF